MPGTGATTIVEKTAALGGHATHWRKQLPLQDPYEELLSPVVADKIQEVGFSYDGIILNAAAYTHTSVGIGDAVKAVETPVVEVHISNIADREPFRHDSHISAGARGVIFGFGLKGYELAVRSFL